MEMVILAHFNCSILNYADLLAHKDFESLFILEIGEYFTFMFISFASTVHRQVLIVSHIWKFAATMEVSSLYLSDRIFNASGGGTCHMLPRLVKTNTSRIDRSKSFDNCSVHVCFP